MGKKSYTHIILCSIVLFYIFMGIFTVNRPLLGNFSSRQVYYAMMGKNFLQNGYQLLLPQVDMIRNGKPQIFLADLPLTAYAAAIFYKFIGISIEFWGRLLSILFFMFSLFMIFKIVKLITNNERAAAITAIFFALSPVIMIYSQSFLLDVPAIFFVLAMFHYLLTWSATDKITALILASLCGTVAFLLRWQVGFLLLPLMVIFFKRYKLKSVLRPDMYIFLILLLAPAFAWYFLWINSASNNLPNAINVVNYCYKGYSLDKAHFPDPIYFDPNFYVRLFDVHSTMTFGPIFFSLLLLSLTSRRLWKEHAFVLSWFFSIIIFYMVFPRKPVELNYYTTHIVPPAAIIVGITVSRYADTVGKESSRKFSVAALILLIAVSSIRYSFAPMFVTPKEDRNILELGKFVDKTVEKDALLIASHRTNIDLLYYCNRKGWEFFIDSQTIKDYSTAAKISTMERLGYIFDPIARLEELKKQGARYFIVANESELDNNRDFKEYLLARYQRVKNDYGYLIFRLN